MIYIVMEKVDEDTRRKWKDPLDFTRLPTWDDCSNVLERRCQFLESVDINHTFVAPRKPDHQSGKSKSKNSKPGYTFSVSKRSCVLCSKSLPYCQLGMIVPKSLKGVVNIWNRLIPTILLWPRKSDHQSGKSKSKILKPGYTFSV